MKGTDSGEAIAARGVGNIEVLRATECKKFFFDMSGKEKAKMRGEALRVLPVIESWLDGADVIILDEALPAVSCGILDTEEILGIIKKRGKTEIVLTGRDAPKEILEEADLITEMKEIRHYYKQGVKAREGIEY